MEQQNNYCTCTVGSKDSTKLTWSLLFQSASDLSPDNKLMFVVSMLQLAIEPPSGSQLTGGSLQSLDWNGRMEWWNGIVECVLWRERPQFSIKVTPVGVCNLWLVANTAKHGLLYRTIPV